jgi:ribosomal protein L4
MNVYDIVKKDNLIIIDDALKFVEERLLWVWDLEKKLIWR